MRLLLFLLLSISALFSQAQTLRLAVASNFRPTLQALAPAFTQSSGIELRISSGASGQLATQILQGAPFDIFLSADSHYPEQLHQRLGGSEPITYARGQLWLVSHLPSHNWQQLLRESPQVALANPKLAPYGAAAQALMQGLDFPVPTQVQAANIAQVRQWYDTGHASTAWLAGSLVPAEAPARFNLTEQLNIPIDQQLWVVSSSSHAQRFVTFLLSPAVQQQLSQLGYEPVQHD